MTTTALLVIGNGRLDYLHKAVVAARDNLPRFDHHLMVDDSGNLAVRNELANTYPDWTITHHDDNLGMAAAVQAGFSLVLSTDADYVFWLEEDMLLTAPPPVAHAINVLARYQYIAQMMFRRSPVNDEEHASGCVLRTLCDHSTWVVRRDHWTEYNYLFSLNPCIIPRRILEYGWPPGPIGTGNETGFTERVLSHNHVFASWGHPHDSNIYVEHIGHERASQWKL